MLIRLTLEGELLDALVKDAKSNCRTNPQQIVYLLRQVYEGNIIVPNNAERVLIKVDESTDTDRKSTSNVLQVYKGGTEIVQDMYKDDTEDIQIDDDIINF